MGALGLRGFRVRDLVARAHLNGMALGGILSHAVGLRGDAHPKKHIPTTNLLGSCRIWSSCSCKVLAIGPGFSWPLHAVPEAAVDHKEALGLGFILWYGYIGTISDKTIA